MIISEPALIEKRSMEIISEELEEKGIRLIPEREDVIKRVIHCTADFSYAETLTFSENAVAHALQAIQEGCDVVTDTNMAKAGINKMVLAGLGGEVHCFMGDKDVSEQAAKRKITRAEVSMEKSKTLQKTVIYAIGNAPTALLKLADMVRKEEIHPCIVIGVPVGFVNILEAKEAIMECGVEYIVSTGRKGGSNVAAAIVNALMYKVTR